MKIATIVGARPQFIKMAPLSKEIAKNSDLSEIIIHTGQHFDDNMSRIFFEEMAIPNPDYNLGIHSQSHGAMTGQMLEQIEKVLISERPDWVVVFGDTNSTLAGALAAKKLHIRVAHVESGLRSFNMRMPEEVNRILTDRISDILFCPTKLAIKNLIDEGFNNFSAKIIDSGDIMYEASTHYGKKAKKNDYTDGRPYVLLTIHRAENTDNAKRLEQIILAINGLSKKVKVICPVHPRTRKILEKNHLKTEFTLIDPVGYLNMVGLIQSCQFVMTDSGGLQKEAFFFRKPCITLRDETEWMELVDHGFNFIAGADTSRILELTEMIQDLKSSMDFSLPIYGKGDSSRIIIENLLSQDLI